MVPIQVADLFYFCMGIPDTGLNTLDLAGRITAMGLM